ncbi:MAG: RDD family protein [Erysipelotrichaceae bacterium]|nr:RDD family protein [Erysipelotrichaceae bacterium]MDD3810260.1 RDD family protein [Erysipelotrichaceae bacterium]
MKKLLGKIRNDQANELSMVKRLVSYGLDWYVGAMIASLPIIITYMFRNDEVGIVPMSLSVLSTPDSLSAGGVSFLVAIGYYALVPALVWPGQTLGKKMLKLKIVSNDYRQARIRQIFNRQILAILIVEGSVYSSSNILHQLLTILFKVNIAGVYGYLGLGVTGISIGLVLILKSKRALHDFIAGTRVVDLGAISYQNIQKKIKKTDRKQLRFSKG